MGTSNNHLGEAFVEERKKMGMSRNAMAHSPLLKGKLTGEGLRKIENGERIPRVPTIRLLARAYKLDEKHTKALEVQALELQAQRLAAQVGRKVTFKVGGRPVRRVAVPTTDKRVEVAIRSAVTEMTDLVNRFGVMDADVDYFRKTARGVLYKHLSS